METQNVIETGTTPPRVRKARKRRAAPKAAQPVSLFSKDGARRILSKGAGRWTQSTRTIRKKATRLQKDVKKNVRKKPVEYVLTSAGIALFLGAVVGALLGYRRGQRPIHIA